MLSYQHTNMKKKNKSYDKSPRIIKKKYKNFNLTSSIEESLIIEEPNSKIIAIPNTFNYDNSKIITIPNKYYNKKYSKITAIPNRSINWENNNNKIVTNTHITNINEVNTVKILDHDNEDLDCYINYLPKEILCKIFAMLPEFNFISENGISVCKYWSNILGDINQTINFLDLDSNNKIDRFKTIELLKYTKTIPTETTIQKFTWEFECTDTWWSEDTIIKNGYFDLFCETYYHDIWRNMPLLTWNDILDSQFLTHEDINIALIDVSGIFNLAIKTGQPGLEIILRLIDENYNVNFTLSPGLLDKFGLQWHYSQKHVSAEFIDMLIRKGYCPITPTGLYHLAEYDFPSELLLQYLDIDIRFNWDDYENEISINYMSRCEGRRDAIRYIFLAYKTKLFDNRFYDPDRSYDDYELLPLDHQLVKDFCLFYKLNYIRNIDEFFLSQQNYFRNLSDDENIYLKWVENVLGSCSDVHPLNKIKSYDWYNTTNNFLLVQ